MSTVNVLDGATGTAIAVEPAAVVKVTELAQDNPSGFSPACAIAFLGGVDDIIVRGNLAAVTAILNTPGPSPSVVVGNYYTPLLSVVFSEPTVTCSNPTEPWFYTSVYSPVDGLQTVTVSGRLALSPNQLIAAPFSFDVELEVPLNPSIGFAYPGAAVGFISADNRSTQDTARALQYGGLVAAKVGSLVVRGKIRITDNTACDTFVQFMYQFTT